MATVGETAARREAELRRRAELGESSRGSAVPPVGDVIAEAVGHAFRRLGRRWSALAAGRWWQRGVAAALAIVVITAACAVGVGLVYGLIQAPTVIIAGAGLMVFAGAFLRYVWWGTGR
jgi:hypothetical protein